MKCKVCENEFEITPEAQGLPLIKCDEYRHIFQLADGSELLLYTPKKVLDSHTRAL